MTAYKIANYYHFFIFSLIGVFILLSYCIAGFIGIALTGLGIVKIYIDYLNFDYYILLYLLNFGRNLIIKGEIKFNLISKRNLNIYKKI